MQICPVCERELIESKALTGDRTGMVCGTCGPFDISRTAQTAMGGMEREERELQLEFAKRHASAGSVPFIHNVLE